MPHTLRCCPTALCIVLYCWVVWASIYLHTGIKYNRYKWFILIRFNSNCLSKECGQTETMPVLQRTHKTWNCKAELKTCYPHIEFQRNLSQSHFNTRRTNTTSKSPNTTNKTWLNKLKLFYHSHFVEYIQRSSGVYYFSTAPYRTAASPATEQQSKFD